MKKYEFTDDMAEISGFGGSYENACRQMVVAGLEYLEENKGITPNFKKFENVFGIISPQNQRSQDLVDHMVNAVNPNLGVTGAMVQATVETVCWISVRSWDEYVREMKVHFKKKQEKVPK